MVAVVAAAELGQKHPVGLADLAVAVARLGLSAAQVTPP
jgi:hypothetical protein